MIRGTDKADQLNCDTLDLTMMPPPKPPETETETEDDLTEDGDEPGTAIVDANLTPAADGSTPIAPKSSSGPLTELKLRKAVAQGDAVWLQSEAQGMVARCVELIYEKHEAEGTPDVTYLNGGPSKKLWVEKVEYDTQSTTPGAIKSIMRLTALDATIFDTGPAGFSNVVARGPGKTEERPARNASVVRTAWWEDEMKLLTWREGTGDAPNLPPLAASALRSSPVAPPQGTLRRLITLTGVPKLVDHKSATTLDSRKSIVAEFQAVAKTTPTGGDGPLQIQWMDAVEDAHLTAPSKTLTARRFLKARFINPAPVVAPPVVAAPAGPLVAAATPAPAPAPVEQPKPEPSPERAEPPVDARADRVWARILLGSNGTKSDLKDAQLRGGVMVHQDPAPGKPAGSDASGEALDLFGQGNGLMKFTVAAEEPQASDPKTRLASDSKDRNLPSINLARVDFEGKTIESEKLIVMDQKADFAWTQGNGTFIQMADRGLLDDKGIEGEKPQAVAKSDGPNPKDRLVITWTEEMRFYGRSKDLAGRPAAKIEFRGTSKEVRTPDGRREYRRGVEAKMTDSAIFCDTMDVYLDRIIALNKSLDKNAPKSKSDDPASSEAQIAMLDCRGQNQFEAGVLNRHAGVDITSQKIFPENGLLKERQRIQGIHVIYDKRTGDFEAPGPGITWLYKRKSGSATVEEPLPTASPVASNGRRAPVPTIKIAPLELTKVKFTEGMRGSVRDRQGPGRDRAPRRRVHWRRRGGRRHRPPQERRHRLRPPRTLGCGLPDLRRPPRVQLSAPGRLEGGGAVAPQRPGERRGPLGPTGQLGHRPVRPDHLRFGHRRDLRLWRRRQGSLADQAGQSRPATHHHPGQVASLQQADPREPVRRPAGHPVHRPQERPPGQVRRHRHRRQPQARQDPRPPAPAVPEDAEELDRAELVQQRALTLKD